MQRMERTYRTSRFVKLTMSNISFEIWLTSCRKILYVNIISSGKRIKVKRKRDFSLDKKVPRMP